MNLDYNVLAIIRKDVEKLGEELGNIEFSVNNLISAAHRVAGHLDLLRELEEQAKEAVPSAGT